MTTANPTPDIHPFRAQWGKTLRHAANTGRLLRSQSLFKLLFVLGFAILFELGLGVLFYDGFRFLRSLGGVGTIIIGRLFALFFLGMGAMLAASSIATAYSTLYRSDEVPFLLVRPYRFSQIALLKFLESAGLSSWAFFFIIVPFVASYAIHERLSPLFALWTVMYSVPFVVLCAGLGAIVTMLLVRWAPRGRLVRWAAAALAAGVAVWLWKSFRVAVAPGTDLRFNLISMVPGLQAASNRMLPSWWMAEGLQALIDGEWLRGAGFWLVLATNAALVGLAIEWLGARVFYDGWQLTVAGRERTRQASRTFAWVDRLLAGLPADVRALVAKDVRTFFRDPAQWSQALIFFGLLAMYFANLRSFRYHSLPDGWRNMIAFLNVFSVSSVMCSLGSRFVYPQLSLEGHGFWMLGLSPTTMRRVLVAKFALSASALLVASVSLMLLSSGMLMADGPSRAAAVILAIAVSLAVSGLSTGLGACFMDLEQRNPAAIVSGFGGTLNLVLSLGFMLAAILPCAFIYHLHVLRGVSFRELAPALAGAGVWLVLITTAATVVPLWAGCRSLEKREF